MKRWLEGSVSRQIILWNVLVLAVLFGVLGFTVRTVVRRSILGQIDQELMNRIRVPRERGRGPAFNQGPGQPPQGPPEGQGVQFNPGNELQGQPIRPRMIQDRYRPIFFELDGTGGEREPLSPAGLNRAKATGVAWEQVTIDGEPVRVVSAMIPARAPHTHIIQCGYPMRAALGAVQAIDGTLFFLAPVALIMSVIGGFLLGQSMTKRVGLLSEAAQQITGGDFSARLPVQGDDEFASLAGTVNGLLARQQEAFVQKEEAMEQQRRFVGDASHELKTPLTTIRGNVQLASQQAGLSEPVLQSLQEIDRASADMNKLVGGLLELAKADAGRMGQGKVELLLSDLLNRAVQRSNARSSVPVEFDLASADISVTGNEDELERLFSNLIENARRYSPSDSPVWVKAEQLGTTLKVQVMDRGPGIPPEDLRHLGERFYRVDTARARQDGGTGLGLAICREIAQAHGGRLEFQSQVGVGTVAIVWLPS